MVTWLTNPTAIEFTKNYLKDETVPAELSDEYKSKLRNLTEEEQLDIERYQHVFSNDLTPVMKYIDELFEGKKDYFDNKKKVKEDANEEDIIKFSDLEYFGKSGYDLMYRKDSENAKRARRKILENPAAQMFIGPATGIYNTAAGITELAAALIDLGLDTNTLATVEKVLPAIDMMDLYGDQAGSIAKFTSLLTQYGTGWGIARKIAQKVITKAAKNKMAKKAVAKTLAMKHGDKAMSLAKYGGYWVLPVALGDAMVSTQANQTLGDMFGDPDAEGHWYSPVQKALANSQQESLEGLAGKERAAAILRNKLKFGAEGTAFMSGLTLVGPSLKVAAKGTGKVLGGHTLKSGKHIPGAGDILVGGTARLLRAETPGGYGLPAMFRKISKGKKDFAKWSGIPPYEQWKFSEWNKPWWKNIRYVTEATTARFMSNFKFDPASANALRGMTNKIRKIKKNSDLWMKQLDRNMYGLVQASFKDIAFNTRTATKAMGYWDDVLNALRGKVKIEQLPKSLRYPTRAIREIIDKQTKELQPIIREMDVREEMVKNMGKYLHTSYQIFKNNNWRASKEVYEKGVDYFVGLLKNDARYKNYTKRELRAQARLRVNRLMEIGRSDSMGGPNARLKAIANSANDIKNLGNIFKDVKNLPDEVARLLGRVDDPKQIILDTIVEQAHTIHSYNAYRDLAKIGQGRWLFRNQAHYDEFVRTNKIDNPRDVKEIFVSKPYNIDLEDLFMTGTGKTKERMMALPEMSKAIQDTSVMMDTLLKLPMMKSLLGIKAATQINKTVLSLMTQMRNITTASMFALANGHIGKGASVADNFDMLFKEFLGKTKDPKKLRDMLDEALEAGALDSSTIATELEKMIPDLMGPARNPFKKSVTGKKGEWSVLMDNATSDQLMNRLLTNTGMKPLINKSIEAYQLGDNVWKLFGFNFTKSQLKPAFKNLNDVKKYFREVEGYEWNPLKPGSLEPGTGGRNLKTIDDAIKEVAGIQVRNMYPNYSMVPRFVKNVRKFPILGNFVGFTSEMWRNSYQMLTRGMKEMQSSNPYIRQMGARRLVGYITTVGTLGPMATSFAGHLTGVGKDKIDAWLHSFAPDYQRGHRMIPISAQDPKTKNIKAIDFDAQNPYTDVIKPFSLFLENLYKGPQTDEHIIKHWGGAFVDSFMKAVEPFVAPAIWAETVWELKEGLYSEKEGEPLISRNRKSKSKIVDWKNDPNPWEKVMYHAYNKLLPTTLKSAEKLWYSVNGQVSKYAMEYDPMEESAAILAGVRVVNMNGYDGMKFKMNKHKNESVAASSQFYGAAANADLLLREADLIKRGFKPEYIKELFEKYQANNYRIWSEAYKDVQNMRKLEYTEEEIKEALGNGKRPPFNSKDDIKFLMKGYYNPGKVPSWKRKDAGAFYNNLENINRKLEMNLRPSDIYDRSQLKDVIKNWKYIPLGERDIEKFFGLPLKPKLDPYLDRTKELIDIKKKQFKNQADDQSFVPTAPIGTPELKPENFTASRVYPTNSGTIDQTTGLTKNQSALLSPMEKEIARRNNQGIGSLA